MSTFAAAARVSEEGESVSVSAPSSSSSTDAPGAAGDGHDVEGVDDDGGDPSAVVGRRNLVEMEDKQQLSPVSVLDFPFDDDDGDEEERSDGAGTCCSPSGFRQHHNCAAANLQRKKQKTQQHKIRRFDDDGPTTDLDEARFTTTSSESVSGESVDVDDAHGQRAGHHLPSSDSDDSDEAAKTTTAPRHDAYVEELQISSIDERSQGQKADEQEPDDNDEYRLLARLLKDDDTAAVDEVTEWLLLDFFGEEISRLRSITGPVLGTTAAANNKPLMGDHGNNKVTAALVDVAMDWLCGAGPQWGIGDVMFSGESALKDMERGRRWMCVREEEQDVAAEMEAFLMDGLLDELMTGLVR